MLRPAYSRHRLAALSIEGFDDFVTSIVAPIATGWSESYRVGIAPTEDRHLCTAHNVPFAFPSWRLQRRRQNGHHRPVVASRLLVDGSFIWSGFQHNPVGTVEPRRHVG